MGALRTKFNNTDSYYERVQILTLSPFTIERTMREFGATNYMVKKSRDVKTQNGVLGLPDKAKGKPLSEDLETNVIQFYENDDYSRICPGKDCVSIGRTSDGDREASEATGIMQSK